MTEEDMSNRLVVSKSNATVQLVAMAGLLSLAL